MYMGVPKIRNAALRAAAATLAASMMVTRQAYGASGDGSVDSTVEINDNTANGPVLAASDYFGTSATAIGDLNGDGVGDLAVGASRDDTGGSNRGAVHLLFMNADGSVDSTVKIDDTTANGPDLADFNQFGSSVAALGDLDGDGVEDLAVGAPGDDAGGGFGRGAVHVLFMNTDGSVDSTVEINDTTTNGPALANSDYFGQSVVALGDLDGDGVTDLAVGAHRDATGGSTRGAAYILFMNTDGSVDATAKIDDTTTNGPVLANDDRFGSSVAAPGDLNGDGVEDLAVGALYDDDGDGSNRGAVHVLFMNTDGSVDSTVEINDATTNGPTLAADDHFGVSVAALGDLDLDGVTDLAVGARSDDTGGNGRGAAYLLFMDTDGSVDSTAKIDDTTTNGPVLSDFDQFGSSVVALGDLDGDGVIDLAVGARRDAIGGSQRGAVHILFLGAAPDVVAPSVTLDAPANLAAVSGAAVALTATASDAVGVSGVQFKLDLATAVGAEDTGTPFAATWDSTGVADGDHTLSAVARDAAGNYATSTVTVTVDNTAPAVSIAAPADGGSVSSWAPSVSWGDATSCGYRLGGSGAFTSLTCGSNGADIADPGFGNLTLVARGADAAGNVGYATSTFSYAAPAEEDTPRHSSSGRRARRESLGLADEPRAARAAGEDRAAAPASGAGSPGTTSTSALPPAPGTPFSDFAARDLEAGTTGPDVRALQVFLNAAGFTLAAEGPGSPGQETDRFGALTRAALARWQAANGVSPAAGYYGPRTRAAVAGE